MGNQSHFMHAKYSKIWREGNLDIPFRSIKKSPGNWENNQITF